MDYFVGIDLHSNNCYIGMIDEKDKRKFEMNKILVVDDDKL